MAFETSLGSAPSSRRVVPFRSVPRHGPHLRSSLRGQYDGWRVVILIVLVIIPRSQERRPARRGVGEAARAVRGGRGSPIDHRGNSRGPEPRRGDSGGAGARVRRRRRDHELGDQLSSAAARNRALARGGGRGTEPNAREGHGPPAPRGR